MKEPHEAASFTESQQPNEEGSDTEDLDDEVANMLHEKDIERQRSATATRVDILSKLQSFYTSTPRLKNGKTPILEWWETVRVAWPELYELAKIIHAISSTQVSVERLFSALRFVMHYLRSDFGPEMVDDLILIFSNSNLMKQDILDLIGKNLLQFLQWC